MDIDSKHMMITTFTPFLLVNIEKETEQQIEIFASMNIERTR